MHRLQKLLHGPFFWLLPLVIWTQIVGVSLWWSIQTKETHNVELAAQRGRDMFRMIELMRTWNRERGGVFAIVSGQNQPNPYLKTPNRDQATDKGLALTMVNPAYMTRQLSELSRRHGFYFHMTSNNPLRPANAPDAWERRAIESFMQGGKERIELVHSASGEEFRYMAPLFVDPVCLGCHAEQGEQLGDVRGGISINISAMQILAGQRSEFIKTSVVHGVVWLTVSIMIGVIMNSARQRMFRLNKARTIQAKAIAKKNRDLEEAEKKIRILQREDALTGFLRRDYFDKALQEALDKAEARRESFGLMILELDYFSEYNRSYGALEGDIVMRMVAALLKKRLKKPEVLFSRYIGASFAIGVPSAKPKAFSDFAESLCRAVYQMGIKHEESPIQKFVTVTIGVSNQPAGQVMTAEEMLREAAKLMHQGKQKGHNCVVAN